MESAPCLSEAGCPLPAQSALPPELPSEDGPALCRNGAHHERMGTSTWPISEAANNLPCTAQIAAWTASAGDCWRDLQESNQD